MFAKGGKVVTLFIGEVSDAEISIRRLRDVRKVFTL
jgi:hypothetical protein